VHLNECRTALCALDAVPEGDEWMRQAEHLSLMRNKKGERAGFSESAATDEEQEAQTGNECPPGTS
jgi:hypothetical protein